jgi:hypothetical protein
LSSNGEKEELWLISTPFIPVLLQEIFTPEPVYPALIHAGTITVGLLRTTHQPPSGTIAGQLLPGVGIAPGPQPGGGGVQARLFGFNATS